MTIKGLSHSILFGGYDHRVCWLSHSILLGAMIIEFAVVVVVVVVVKRTTLDGILEEHQTWLNCSYTWKSLS